MAELKTKKTDKSVEKFLNGIKDEIKRKDSFEIMKMMRKVTKAEPKMWGTAIVGFGDYHYKYASGREGDWFVMGLSPRKQNLTLYMMGGIHHQPDKLKQLGKFKTGKGCLYLKKLTDVDVSVLEELLEGSLDILKNRKWEKS